MILFWERPQTWGIIRNTERKRKQRRGGARGRSVKRKVLKKKDTILCDMSDVLKIRVNHAGNL